MSLNQGVNELAGVRVSTVSGGTGGRIERTGVVEHGLQFFLAHISVISNFVLIGVDGDVCGQEENVVHCIVETRVSQGSGITEHEEAAPSCSPHIPLEGAR